MSAVSEKIGREQALAYESGQVLEQVLDGVRTHWLPYPSAGWQAGDGAGQLLASRVISPQLHNERTVLLYLPAAYDAGQQRYPVIYLQDGQNLFDPATAYAGETWRVGETLTQLASEGLEAIVVAPYHMEHQRVQEYNPFPRWRRGRGEAYAQFVADTLKPLVDYDFRTLSDAAHTVIGGSSMGGLISLYAYCTRPGVFGRALVMSPSLWVAQGAAYHLTRARLATGGKLYIDNGTRESSAEPLAAIALEKGYRAGEDLLYVQGQGERHTESAWAHRLPAALRFLLTPA
jgi:predicted alpha/beta superfamily hydrolase